MTDEEIKKIAREYAESKCSIQEYLQAYDRRDNLNEAYYKEGLAVLEWLCKDYCIIPKVEILNQHAWYMQRMKEVSSNRQMNRGKAIALENLFGREMFEEDKK